MKACTYSQIYKIEEGTVVCWDNKFKCWSISAYCYWGASTEGYGYGSHDMADGIAALREMRRGRRMPRYCNSV